MKEDIKNIIIEMSEEFDKMEGLVTCEISIHKDQIPQMEKFVKENTSIEFGNWVFTECSTCSDRNGDGYVHASIERPDVLRKIKKSSNFIKIIS